MRKSLKAVPFGLAGILVASSCLAQERPQRPFYFPDEARKKVQEQEDQRNLRLDSMNRRAQRSICADGCIVNGRRMHTQPADPFAQLPNWEIEPGMELPSGRE
jgi:hypothetical protein